MSLSGNDRAQAQYNATPNTNKLSASEQKALLAALQNIWGVDTTYLVGATVVQPASFAASSGIPVTTAGSATAQTGTTTAPGPLQGTGTIS